MMPRPPRVPSLPPLVVCALAVLPASCSSVQGDEIGTYKVEMHLVQNTCGPGALYTEDGKRYRVQLRATGKTGYWRVGGEKPQQGSYSAGHFKFTYESIVAVSPDDAATFCQLVQSEVLSGSVALPADAGTVDAGESDAGAQDGGAEADQDAGALPQSGLKGQLVFTISAAQGTDCTEALVPIGKYQQLPCEVRYELYGTPVESF